MHFETVARYVLYFFFFSAAGWLFESIYCSIRPGRWVNRGFLTGPLCPIYGSGALVFIIFTQPIKNHFSYPVTIAGHTIDFDFVAVFLAGLVLADIVEYSVSLIMEKLFHSRWWDYSTCFLNINGRICFKHSIYWGLSSVIFNYLIFPFVDGYFSRIPAKLVYISVAVILVIFAIDVIDAVRKALDVREFVDKVRKLREEVSDRLGTTVDALLAMGEGEIAELGDKIEGGRAEFNNRVEELKTSFANLSTGLITRGAKKSRMFREFPMVESRVSEEMSNFEKLREKIRNALKR
ncbi:MAG: hypothetical protein II702_09820 [Clostridia bacterium]|nr:hypothetical protein [Clostridia bacterium]MBQ4245199.1 hypothetical protein [Clostridia bacterium]